MKRRTRQTNINDDDEELKRKLVILRVADLHDILNKSHIAYSKYARKDDLQKLLISALASTSDSLEYLKTRIREEILQAYSKIKSIAPNRTKTPPLTDMYAQQYNNPLAHAVAPYNSVTSGFPIQPDVKLKKLAFYDTLGTLLQPSTLLPTSSARQQEGTYYFHLTPQQATDIAMNRDIRNAGKPEYLIQVQLRFCLLETTSEQVNIEEDNFPPSVQLKVNGKICQLPNPIATNKPGVEPRRPPRPVNITMHVKISPTVANVVHVQWHWQSEITRCYVISCYLVRKLTSDCLLSRMKTKGAKPAEFTRGLIKEKLNEDADSEIATTMLRVSLICPLGKMRMTTPCRASTCLHLQCFDASLYLQMNERKPTWNCPVCDKAALYENLVIDGYFQEVIASPKLGCDDNEIQLHPDGSWSTLSNKNDVGRESPKKGTQKVEVIEDDLELITEEFPKSMIKSCYTSAAPKQTSANDTVVILSSDSEDEDVTRKNNHKSKSNVVSFNTKKKQVSILNYFVKKEERNGLSK